MPHMMNCGHSETGWCLLCVHELHARVEQAEEDAARNKADLTHVIGQWAKDKNAHGERLASCMEAREQMREQNEVWHRRCEQLLADIEQLRNERDALLSETMSDKWFLKAQALESAAEDYARTNAKWVKTFAARCDREHEMIDEAIDDFCDAVLAKLRALGVKETDNCDGDEDVSTIFAGWIHSRISDVECVNLTLSDENEAMASRLIEIDEITKREDGTLYWTADGEPIVTIPKD